VNSNEFENSDAILKRFVEKLIIRGNKKMIEREKLSYVP
jgi:hypothetical protein